MQEGGWEIDSSTTVQDESRREIWAHRILLHSCETGLMELVSPSDSALTTYSMLSGLSPTHSVFSSTRKVTLNKPFNCNLLCSHEYA